MNIIKEIFDLPKTNSGKKRRYNLLNQLNIEKKDKNEIAKAIDSGNLGDNTPTTSQHPFEERYYFDINSFSKDEKILVLDMILGLIPMESSASSFNFIATIDLGDNLIVYDKGILLEDEGNIPYLSQISFNKMVIYGMFGSGFDIESFRSVDSIQLLYNVVQTIEPELFLPVITKLTNNRITADEFWAELPLFEELN